MMLIYYYLTLISLVIGIRIDSAAINTLPIKLKLLQSISTQLINSTSFPAQYFDQVIDHSPNSANHTFKQRYWVDTSNYINGGPVFLLDGGETSGADRIPFLESGILSILSKEFNGIGIILEHRYYGESFPVSNLTTDNMRYLSSAQAVEDNAYLAQNLKLEGIENLNPSSTPWIIYGGSYAGAQAAFTRKRFPHIFWGAIASSAVTEAIINYWEYYNPIREHAPAACIKVLISHTQDIDSVLAFGNSWATDSLKSYFGLGNITENIDFVNALSIPLGFWQAKNWDSEVGSSEFDRFCDALTPESNDDHQSQLVFPGDPRNRFAGYAMYIKGKIATLCPSDMTQDQCFGSDSEVGGTSLEYWRSRSWQYQVCTEWGFFQVAAPAGTPSLVSSLITEESASKFCSILFPPGKLITIPTTPDVERINQLGGYKLNHSRIAFIDGEFDPWIGATPHSPHSPPRLDNLSQPFKIIQGGVHHWDENGKEKEPKIIKKIHKEEIEFVGYWLKEWRERGRWKTKFEKN